MRLHEVVELSLLARSYGLRLLQSDEFDGLSTLDLVNGLHGVCHALDPLLDTDCAIDEFAELGVAAKILSSILPRRVEL